MIAACACIGWSRALRLAQRVEELERFRAFLQMLCTEIRFSAAPLASLIRQHAGESKWLQACAALLEQGTPFPQAWQRASQTAPVPKQDRMLLREFGEGLGVSDVEGQIACTLCCRKNWNSCCGRLDRTDAEVEAVCDARNQRWRGAGAAGDVKRRDGKAMDVDLIFKIAAIGIIVAVLNQLLIRSGREEQAMMTTLAGLVVSC